MVSNAVVVMTVEEILSVDVLGQKGIAVRFRTDEGTECAIQFPHREAHTLVDMVAIAIRQLPAPPGTTSV
jgi:hypothetical protein